MKIISMSRFYESDAVAACRTHEQGVQEASRLAVAMARAYITHDGTPDRCEAYGVLLITLDEFLKHRALAGVVRQFTGEFDLDAVRLEWEEMLGAVGLQNFASTARTIVRRAQANAGAVTVDFWHDAQVMFVFGQWYICPDGDSAGAHYVEELDAVRALVALWMAERRRPFLQAKGEKAQKAEQAAKDGQQDAPAPAPGIYAIHAEAGRLAGLVKADSIEDAMLKAGQLGLVWVTYASLATTSDIARVYAAGGHVPS
jgi:hypothetical protein